MKTLITNYTFNKVAKQITFSGLTAIELERVFLITDVTNNIIIYNFADVAKGGSVSGNVLILDFNTNTVSYSNSDDLQIFYDLEEKEQENQEVLLRRIVKLLESNAVVDYANRQRIKLDALGGVEVTTTVPISGNIGGTVAVSGITAIGGNDPRYQFIYEARTSYAVMRQGLVFS